MNQKSTDKEKLNVIPRHVAVIMDGNGRWAQRVGFARRKGHSEGAESVRQVVRECVKSGVSELTLYAFSTENWRRPATEVKFLMGLLKRFLVSERAEMMENKIRFRAIGHTEGLPADIRKELAKTCDLCSKNDGMIVRLALNYGARQEIVDAARRIALASRNGLDPAKLDEKQFNSYLYDDAMTDPDILIRTGGEMRLSNFLLWQMSYTELYFTPTCWPEFRAEELRQAFQAYGNRERRFGGLNRKKSGKRATR